MLTLEGLSIRQGTFHLAAELSLPAGGITAVIGPSGGGKSTLLSAIAGFVAPEAGRILWEGVEIGGRAPGARPVTMLFQDNNLFPHLTAIRNVALGLTVGRPDRHVLEAARAALAEVGLAEMAERKPGTLSGGQQGRVALARAMLADRPLVLLDEPFAALGPALKAEALALVARLAAAHGRTVLMVTHDPKDATEHAERCLLVADGRVTGPHETRALFADPPEALARYLGR